MLIMVASGFAQFPPNVCSETSGTIGTGGTLLKWGVAANFYQSAQTLAANFVAAYPAYSVVLCSNNTATLAANITLFDYFYGADTTAQSYNALNCKSSGSPSVTPVAGCAFTYAYGLPVLYGWMSAPPSIPSITNLIPDVSGLLVSKTIPPYDFTNVISYNLTPVNKNYDVVPSTGTGIAMAAYPAAPYGQAAQNILSAMGSSAAPDQFTTVTDVFNNVGTGIYYSGFLAKAQICQYLPFTTYVQFPDYRLNQMAIKVTTNANDLDTYMRSQITPNTADYTAYVAFLQNNCYIAP